MDGEKRRKVEKVVREADTHSGIIILSCFYQRQHSHSALYSRQDIMNAVKNTLKWIKEKRFRNVLLEISN